MPALLFTKNNIASKNIANALIDNGYCEAGKNTWEKNGVKLIDTEAPTVIDVPTDFDTDYIVVLSSHKSRKDQKALTAHFPGNWGNADFGGAARTLNIACASKLKIIIQNLQ